MSRNLLSLLVAGAAFFTVVSDAAAQATGTPVFRAPYRSFEQHEFGASLSFPDGADLGIEGQYSFGFEQFDIGLRGGFVDFADTTGLVLGVEGRARVLDHTESDFPLDGAVVVGLGTVDFDTIILPAGFSLGRRVAIEDFEFTFYGQPTLFLTSGNGDTDLDFNLGLGVDFTIAESVDLRTSFAFLDAPGDGISFSVIWVR